MNLSCFTLRGVMLPGALAKAGNAQARTEFVNVVAAPLLNKMIDCNMLPGGQ